MEIHFFAYVNFMALSFVSLLCFIFMNVCRLIIMPIRLVLKGGLSILVRCGLQYARYGCMVKVQYSFHTVTKRMKASNYCTK